MMKTSGTTIRGVETEMRDPRYLYQIAVQSPEHDIQFFDRVYKRKNGRLPRTLREDFCGTALLSTRWVQTRPENVAVAVDHDLSVLEWARAHNVRPLGRDASRVRLVHGDVRNLSEPRADIVAALNYSYFALKERRHLLGYFRAVFKCLGKGGIFVLDVFGGWETQMKVTDTTRQNGFTYVWEQREYDPLTNRAQFHIHFEFDRAKVIKNAFSYDWRMWSIPEVRDALADAGFGRSDVYWEGIDPDTGEGDGVYRLVKRVRNSPGWNALVVAS